MSHREPPGRLPLVSVDTVVEALRLMIAGRAGHPCPSNKHYADALEVNEQVVRTAMRRLEKAQELQIQRTAFIGGLRRRMRVKVRGRWREWTELTKRRAYDLKITAPDLLRRGRNAHHLERILGAGRYD